MSTFTRWNDPILNVFGTIRKTIPSLLLIILKLENCLHLHRVFCSILEITSSLAFRLRAFSAFVELASMPRTLSLYSNASRDDR